MQWDEEGTCEAPTPDGPTLETHRSLSVGPLSQHVLRRAMVWRGERFHVLILGSRRVGKSALLQQLARSSFKEEVDVQMAKMEETVTVQCCVDQQSLLVDGKGRCGERVQRMLLADVGGTRPIASYVLLAWCTSSCG